MRNYCFLPLHGSRIYGLIQMFNFSFDRLLPALVISWFHFGYQTLCTVTWRFLWLQFLQTHYCKCLVFIRDTSHGKSACDVLQLLRFMWHLVKMMMISLGYTTFQRDPFKIVFTCLFDHIVFKCLETVLIWLPLPTDPVPYLSAFLSTCKY